MRYLCLIGAFLISFSSFSQQVNDLVERGIDAMEDAEYEEAWAHFNEALIYEPNHLEARVGRGRALYRLGAFTDALEDLKYAVRAGGDKIIPLDLIGKMHVAMDQCDSALVYWERADRLDTTNANIKIGIAKCLRELGRCKETERWLDQIQDGDKGQIAFERGMCKIETANYQQALDLFAVVPRGKWYEDARYWSGRCHVYLENYIRAVTIFNSLLMGNPDNDDARFYRAQAYLLAEDYTHAVEDFKALHKLYPTDIDILERLAHCQFLMADYMNASTSYGKIIDRDVENHEAWYKRGLCKYQLGQYEQAVDDFEVLGDRYPEDANIQYYLGLCYLGLEQWVAARSLLQNAVEIDENHHRAHLAIGDADLKLGAREEACARWVKLLGTDEIAFAQARLDKYCQ